MVAVELARDAEGLELAEGAEEMAEVALGRLERHVAHNELGGADPVLGLGLRLAAGPLRRVAMAALIHHYLG